MRKTNSQQFRFTNMFLIFIIILTSITMISNTVLSQEEKQLYIGIFDCEEQIYLNDSTGFIFFEGRQYEVDIFYEDEIDIPIEIYNVTITLPWNTYYISYNQDISIESPSFEDYSEFIITASKEGYKSAEQYIVVSKGELRIKTDRDLVDENKGFSVTITDQKGVVLPGVTVYIDDYENSYSTTNEDGKAFIDAPEVQDDITLSITAIKSGYYPASCSIHVENNKETLLGDFFSKIFEVSPIAFAVLMLIIAMLIVKIRNRGKKQFSKLKTEDINEDKKLVKNRQKIRLNKHSMFKQKNIYKKKPTEKVSKLKDEPHVEVIRIHGKTCKKDKAKQILDNRQDTNVIPLNKNNEYEWFNGTDDMKNKLDKLTNNKNDKPADKWFVGENNGKFKVDKKLTDIKLKKSVKRKSSFKNTS